jgi:hypothetical protein
MENENGLKKDGTKCPLPDPKGVVRYISEGQLCPHCGFAELVKEPGNIIRCPVCGYGNSTRDT